MLLSGRREFEAEGRVSAKTCRQKCEHLLPDLRSAKEGTGRGGKGWGLVRWVEIRVKRRGVALNHFFWLYSYYRE